MIKPVSRTTSVIVKSILHKSIDGAMTCREKKKDFFSFITKTSNAATTFSLNGKVAKFEDKKIFSIIDHALKVKNRTEWLEDEKTSLLSSEINKVIDTACEQYGQIKNSDKENIFKKLSSEFDVRLDSRCTQSTISQMLYNNQAVSKEVRKLHDSSQSRDERNKINNWVNKKITDIVYINKFRESSPDSIRTRTAEEMALLVKKNRLEI